MRAVQEREGRYRAFFERSPEATVLTDGQRILLANPAALAMMRAASAAEVVGLDALRFVHADSLPVVRQRVAALLAAPGTSVPFIDLKYLDLAGGILEVESGATSFVENGEIRILIETRDNARRVRAESALRESEERFRHLTALSSDWYWEIDTEYRFTRISGAGLAAFGLSEEQLLGRRASEVSVYRLVSPTAEEFSRLRSARQPYRDVRGEFIVEGSPARHVSIDGDPFFDANGVFLGYRGITRDITERVEAERRVRASEARFRSLTELSSDWYWEQDSEFRQTFVSEGYAAKLVSTLGKTLGSKRWERPGATPMHGTWADHRAVLEAHLPFRNFEYSRVADDGRRVFVSLSGEPVFGPNGEFVGYRGIGRDISEHWRAAQAIEDAKEQLRRAMEGSDLVLWDTDLRTGEVFLSEGWAKLLGEPAGETRTTVGDLMELVPPEERPALEKLAGEVAKGLRDSYSVEHRVRTRAGDWKWIRSAGRVNERDADGKALRISGTNLDITVRKLAENALHESEARFRSIFEHSFAGIAIWGMDGRYIAVNQAHARFLGYEPEELAGKIDVNQTRAPEDTDGAYYFRKMVSGELEHYTRERCYLRKDGERVWGRVSSALVRDASGVPQYVVNVTTDIGEVRKARLRIEQMNTELEERVRSRTAELQALVKELETFHYAVAHDVRTSLGVMSVNAGMLLNDLKERLPAGSRRVLVEISRNSQIAATLLDDLLEYVRLGGATLERNPVAMVDLVTGAWRDLRRAEAGRQVVFEAGNLPDAVGDQRMLAQLWARLLSNAVKFTRTRERAKIEVGYSRAQKAYFVRDNGIGFDMRHAGKLFGLFERLHRDDRFEGTGVGLALAARIVQRHGGRIWTEAQPESGATFWFLIPDKSAERAVA